MMYWPTFLDYDEINANVYFVKNKQHTVVKLDNKNNQILLGGITNKFVTNIIIRDIKTEKVEIVSFTHQPELYISKEIF